MTISCQLDNLKQKVESAVQQFSTGTPILIGDDGKRENEVDFVFHASFASKEMVNFAITHAKGLLCVALNHSIADKLGFHSAPRFPGSISHTNFTLSVDAKNGITSGISAKDRAHTIRLMASTETQPTDFITPGHVFPLRAVQGGLMSRAGHTEAIFELCHLSQLPCAGAMCEVLGETGEPISPSHIREVEAFAKLPFITTIDLLWYKCLFTQFNPSIFCKSEGENRFVLNTNAAEFINLPCAIQFYSPQQFDPNTVRIVLNNGFSSKDNSVKQEECCAEIVLFSFESLLNELPQELHEFCDLSGQVGLKNTKASVKRFVTLLQALKFVAHKMEVTLKVEHIEKINFPVPGDSVAMKSTISSF